MVVVARSSGKRQLGRHRTGIFEMIISNAASSYASASSTRKSNAQTILSSDSQDAASASTDGTSQQGKSYDFTSISPSDLQKAASDLLKSGQLTGEESGLLALHSGGSLQLLNGSQAAQGSQPENFLQKLQQAISYDSQNPYAQSSQVQAEQSLLDKLTALQGTSQGVDKLA
jgi:hypothetical protein